MGEIDTLTGLKDRTSFEVALTQAFTDADSVALALADLDGFHEINMTYGHAVGDEVLRQVAGVLSAALPDQVYRLGGDEFALLMPETSLEKAFLRMELLRTQVLAIDIPQLPSGHRLTITIGVAQHPRDAKDARSLSAAAGAAQASAKESGRNQVGLPPTEESMVMKSCYYSASSLAKLKSLAEKLRRKESQLLREALSDILRKYDTPGAM